MVRSKTKAAKGDAAFTKRKQKVGKARLAPATETRAEVSSRGLRILAPASDVRRPSDIASVATTGGRVVPTAATTTTSTAADRSKHPGQSLDTLLAGVRHYKSAHRLSSLNGLKSMMKQQHARVTEEDVSREPALGSIATRRIFFAALDSLADNDSGVRAAAAEASLTIFQLSMASALGQTTAVRLGGDATTELVDLLPQPLPLFESALPRFDVALTHADSAVRKSTLSTMGKFLALGRRCGPATARRPDNSGRAVLDDDDDGADEAWWDKQGGDAVAREARHCASKRNVSLFALAHRAHGRGTTHHTVAAAAAHEGDSPAGAAPAATTFGTSHGVMASGQHSITVRLLLHTWVAAKSDVADYGGLLASLLNQLAAGCFLSEAELLGSLAQATLIANHDDRTNPCRLERDWKAMTSAELRVHRGDAFSNDPQSRKRTREQLGGTPTPPVLSELKDPVVRKMLVDAVDLSMSKAYELWGLRYTLMSNREAFTGLIQCSQLLRAACRLVRLSFGNSSTEWRSVRRKVILRYDKAVPFSVTELCNVSKVTMLKLGAQVAFTRLSVFGNSYQAYAVGLKCARALLCGGESRSDVSSAGTQDSRGANAAPTLNAVRQGFRLLRAVVWNVMNREGNAILDDDDEVVDTDLTTAATDNEPEYRLSSGTLDALLSALLRSVLALDASHTTQTVHATVESATPSSETPHKASHLAAVIPAAQAQKGELIFDVVVFLYSVLRPAAASPWNRYVLQAQARGSAHGTEGLSKMRDATHLASLENCEKHILELPRLVFAMKRCFQAAVPVDLGEEPMGIAVSQSSRWGGDNNSYSMWLQSAEYAATMLSWLDCWVRHSQTADARGAIRKQLSILGKLLHDRPTPNDESLSTQANSIAEAVAHELWYARLPVDSSTYGANASSSVVDQASDLVVELGVSNLNAVTIA